MTSGFGVDASADLSSGTTSQDIRRILAAQHTAGILTGCDTVTSASDMTYTVTSGVVAIPISEGELVLAPVDQATIVTDPAPSAGETRIDKIYVQQRIPSIHGDANVIVGVTAGLIPPYSVEITHFSVIAGNKNTNEALRTGYKAYSVPLNGSMGQLHYWQSGLNGVLPSAEFRQGHGKLFLPTDRKVKFKVTAVLYSSGAVGFDNSHYCEYGFLFNRDNQDFVLHTTPGLHQAWATYEFNTTIELAAGEHTVNLGMRKMIGPGDAATAFGTDPSGFGRRGIEFSIYDEGPVLSAYDYSPSA